MFIVFRVIVNMSIMDTGLFVLDVVHWGRQKNQLDSSYRRSVVVPARYSVVVLYIIHFMI
jgi:hypothetical protein